MTGLRDGVQGETIEAPETPGDTAMEETARGDHSVHDAQPPREVHCLHDSPVNAAEASASHTHDMEAQDVQVSYQQPAATATLFMQQKGCSI
jgi:hypothetical protein